MVAETRIRKWGNSAGIILPKEFVRSRNLKPDDVVIVEVLKKADLTSLFGSLKTKLTAQQLKDLARSGW